MGNGGDARYRAAGWTVFRRELPWFIRGGRRIVLIAVMAVCGAGAVALLQLVPELYDGWGSVPATVLAAIGGALFGALFPALLWVVFDKGRAPHVAVLEERLIEKVLAQEAPSHDLDAIQRSVRARRMLLPGQILTQGILAGVGLVIPAAGLLLGVSGFSLIAFPFVVAMGAITIPGHLASLGRAEAIVGVTDALAIDDDDPR